MRADDDFRKKMNEISEDEDASWAAIREAGYEFTMSEFKQAQEVIYAGTRHYADVIFVRRIAKRARARPFVS